MGLRHLNEILTPPNQNASLGKGSARVHPGQIVLMMTARLTLGS